MQFQKIKTNLSEMLAESTANGLPRIFKSKKIFFKIFWFSFFILGNIASFYYIIKAIDNYLVYDVISRRTTIYKNPMPFPAITICPWKSSGFEFTNKSLKQIIEFNNCWFNNENIDPDKYFERVSSFYYGDCFHFNSGRKNMLGDLVPIQNQYSIDYGLYVKFINASIYISINEPLSIPFINGFFYKRFDYSIEVNNQIMLIINKIFALNFAVN